LKKDVSQISKFSCQINSADFAGMVLYNDQNQEIFNFGKHKGVPVEDVFKKEPGYYSWIMNGDFPLYTKKVLTAVKLRASFGSGVK
jgi:DNA polymerase-3 subunit epsilon